MDQKGNHEAFMQQFIAEGTRHDDKYTKVTPKNIVTYRTSAKEREKDMQPVCADYLSSLLPEDLRAFCDECLPTVKAILDGLLSDFNHKLSHFTPRDDLDKYAFVSQECVQQRVIDAMKKVSKEKMVAAILGDSGVDGYLEGDRGSAQSIYSGIGGSIDLAISGVSEPELSAPPTFK